MSRPPFLLALAAFGLAMAGRKALRRAHAIDLRGQTALVTGSSRGLGLAIARELAREGCRIVMCARDQAELERARADVESLGAEVLAVPCDVTDRQQVSDLIQRTRERFGDIDVLVNNAGVIMVGPLAEQTLADYEECMAVMFWGTVYTTMEVLPAMRSRGSGRIANITSIGGKVSVPHLAPYTSAKYAAVGFSESLHVEAAQDGVVVTTVVPGLMRTGSHVNALFKGQHRLEFGLFSVLANLPFTSISANDAARQIVRGIREGEAEIILGWQAKVLTRLHGLMPGLDAEIMALVNRALPGPGGIGTQRATGKASRSPITESPIEALGHSAARDLNQ